MELNTTVSGFSHSRIPKVRATLFEFVSGHSSNLTSVWRTSTPEPTYQGIMWTYTKDMTRYIPLFSKPGAFILELDNVVEAGLDGEYDSVYHNAFSMFHCIFTLCLSTATLYATFYSASEKYPTAGQSNLIVPISTMLNNTADEASVPPAFSVRR
jgi:hypothetical protein